MISLLSQLLGSPGCAVTSENLRISVRKKTRLCQRRTNKSGILVRCAFNFSLNNIYMIYQVILLSKYDSTACRLGLATTCKQNVVTPLSSSHR